MFMLWAMYTLPGQFELRIEINVFFTYNNNSIITNIKIKYI